MRSNGDAPLDGWVDIPRVADQIPETVIVTTLGASFSGHHSIMTDPAVQAIGLMAIAQAPVAVPQHA
jgi:hypothetical protein